MHRNDSGRGRAWSVFVRIVDWGFTLLLAAACGVALIALLYVIRLVIWTPY